MRKVKITQSFLGYIESSGIQDVSLSWSRA